MNKSSITLPRGVGLAFRPQLETIASSYPALVNYLEIPINMYTQGAQRRVCDPDYRAIKAMANQLPLIAHGPCFSLGPTAAIESLELASCKTLMDHFNIQTFSEHLSFFKGSNKHTFSFLTLPFTEQVADYVASKIIYLQQVLQRPFLLENITQHFTFEGSELSETEFITRIVEKANCGIMLDVANLFINSVNHQFDPYQFISELPADRIWQCHFCGADVARDDYLIDSHQQATLPDIWKLLDYALKNTALQAITLERDSRFEYQMEVIDELWTAQEYWQKYQAKAPVEVTINLPKKPVFKAHFQPLEQFQDAVMDALFDNSGQSLAAVLDNVIEKNALSSDWGKLLHSVQEKGFRIAQHNVQSEPSPHPVEVIEPHNLPAL